MRNIHRLDPGHVPFLEPLPISCEITDRTRLKRLQAARPCCSQQRRTPAFGVEMIRSEAVRPQVALVPGLGDLWTRTAGVAENAMLYVPRREIGSKRKSIGPGTNDAITALVTTPPS